MLKKYWAVVLFGIFGLFFIWIRPPFQAPDEVNHFYQIYHYSELKLKPDIGQESLLYLPNRSGAFLPKGFAAIKSYVFKSAIEPTLHSFTFTDYAKTRSRIELTNDMQKLQTDTVPADLIYYYQKYSISPYFRETVNVTVYSPLAYLQYLPSAILGQLLNLSPYQYFRLLQITVLLIYLLNFYYLIKNNTKNKALVYFLLFNPMLIFLATSISADNLLILSSLMLYGLVFTTQNYHNGISKKLIIIYSVILSGIKFPYFFLLLPIILSKKVSAKQRKEIIFAGILGLTFWIIWLGIIHNYIQPYNLSGYGDIYPSDLHTTVLGFIRSFLESLPGIITGVVGFFGWLEYPIPKILVIAYLLFPFFVNSKQNKHNSDRLLSTMTGMLLFLIFILISLQLFLFWYGNGLAGNGWQGRYLIPLLPAILIFIKESKKPNWQLLLLIVPLFYSAGMLFNVYR